MVVLLVARVVVGGGSRLGTEAKGLRCQVVVVAGVRGGRRAAERWQTGGDRGSFARSGQTRGQLAAAREGASGGVRRRSGIGKEEDSARKPSVVAAWPSGGWTGGGEAVK